MSNLTPEATLAVQKETRRTVTGIAAVFGVANIVVALAAVWSFWSYAQSQVKSISENVRNDVFDELTSTRQDIRDAVNSANKLIGRLEERSNNLDKLDTDIESLDSRVELLSQDKLLSGASAFLESWDGSEDVDALVKSLDSKVAMQPSVNCESARIFSGSQPQGSLNWQQYDDNPAAAYSKIDTSEAEFSNTPIYFVSISGSGSWSAQGTSAIYDASSSGFSTYIQWSNPASTSDMVSYASKYWTIHWIAMGC